MPPQHFGRGEPGRPAADDHDSFGFVRFGARLRFRLRAFLTHEDLAVALLHVPCGDRTEGGRANGLAGAKVKTGMMPGASYCVIDDQPLRERATVVGALRADGEDLSATAYEQNRLLSDMTEELGAVRQFGGGDAERQIGTGGSRLYVSHCVLPGRVASFTNA